MPEGIRERWTATMRHPPSALTYVRVPRVNVVVAGPSLGLKVFVKYVWTIPVLPMTRNCEFIGLTVVLSREEKVFCSAA